MRISLERGVGVSMGRGVAAGVLDWLWRCAWAHAHFAGAWRGREHGMGRSSLVNYFFEDY